jgi:murein DD-endopeptidase MepM/ murein hydrolase activator NlpD
MTSNMTRPKRAYCWRTVRTLVAATFAISSMFCAAGAMAQVKAPPKNQLKKPAPRTAAPPSSAPSEDVQAFSIAADSTVVQQLILLRVDPSDAQAAADAVSKALSQPEVKAASSGRAVLAPQGAGQPKRLVSLQLYSNKSLAVDLARGADGSFGFKLAPGATEDDDERVSSLPGSAPTSGAGARSVVADSVKTVKTSSATLATSLAPTGANPAALKELTQALAGFSTAAARIDVVQGRTVDGTPRVLVASLGDGAAKQSFWWFAPPNQPEGWFDDQGRRLGGTALANPRPDARMSSPFGTRHYYGRKSSNAFHNGIDFEGKTGEPIYAAADGVINHQGWYFNYGRTVKIGHADNFETLYAHMSRFADGVGPGTRVRKGDLIGYVGSTGRSTGAHLHFSVIVNGQFVDPAPYISDKGGHNALSGEQLVSYRQWQQEIKRAADRGRSGGENRYPGLQGAEPWSSNPFSSRAADRL